MGLIKSLVSIIIPIDDMTKPRKEAKTESRRQAYNRLNGTANLSPEELEMLHYLAAVLGIRE